MKFVSTAKDREAEEQQRVPAITLFTLVLSG
jgi:hypothetical protein